MDATAIIYNLDHEKGKAKTYLIRKILGYKDYSNKQQYKYERPGLLTRYIYEKWGKSVLIIKRESERRVATILNKNKIKFNKVRIKIEN